jgi:predicted lipid-binding transport protein (Tim44 family)
MPGTPASKDPWDTADEIQQFNDVKSKSVSDRARQQLLARDPGFNEAAFLQQAKAMFMTLQKAKTDRALEPVRAQLTDLMYNTWKARGDAMAAQHRRTVITNLQIDDATIARVLTEPDADIITVQFDGTAVISDVDDRTGRTRSGTPIPDGFTEYWTFIRHTGPASTPWMLDEVTKPADWRLTG